MRECVNVLMRECVSALMRECMNEKMHECENRVRSEQFTVAVCSEESEQSQFAVKKVNSSTVYPFGGD